MNEGNPFELEVLLEFEVEERGPLLGKSTHRWRKVEASVWNEAKDQQDALNQIRNYIYPETRCNIKASRILFDREGEFKR